MAEEPDLKGKVVELDPNEKAFTANGKRYRVASSLSVDRYEAYELLQVEIGFARTFQQFHEQAQQAYDLCNKIPSGQPVFADLAITLRDMVTGATMVGTKQTPAVLKLCSLFIIREGEDQRYIDEQTMADKIDDWRIEGISMTYFFQFALHSIPGFLAAYRSASPNTSGSNQAESVGEKVEGV